ncbi:hypothetical protein Gogos_021039 [Gossypium gossypioides]|uniref:DUF4283 domain-containing protein n=1 Tax=Gossypium gossypioides TaxID=34282 RepID=A0A7J9CXL0_GOSGO|nr:hypothetical protein [Gossypium gossypioides]
MNEELANLNLDDEEEELILCENDLNDLEDDYRFCLVGKALIECKVHFPSLKRTLANLWHPLEEHLIVFHRLNNGEDLMKVPLVYIDFWVQIYLPFGVISEGLARQLGHREGFCPVRLTIGTQEEGNAIVQGVWNMDQRETIMENKPIKSCEGKKRQRPRVDQSNGFGINGLLIEFNKRLAAVEKVQLKCCFVNGIDVGTHGSKEGLPIGWKGDYVVQLKSFSTNHIDLEVKDGGSMPSWRFTRFYSAPEEHKRRES